jgi:hypothetical protein
LALALDNSIPVLEFVFKSYVNTLTFPFMLLFMAIVIIATTLFENFSISMQDFLVAPLLGPFVVPFDKPLTLPIEKQPPFLMTTKV